MEIRVATVADAESIREVARAAWETDYPDIVSRETITDTVEEWYGTERMRSAVEESGTVVLVADEDGDVVGFSHAAVSTESWTGAILRLYVRPDRRRKGTGDELLQATIGELQDRDCDRIEAMVLADNEVGNEFYRSAGFERDDSGETRIGGESFEEHRYVYQ